ncbi:MAG: UDP-N-acetylmuramate--L-alanine ligase [Verrucomicrobiia bacterium]|jgi:UDP-N-acetylmuramate--L-alanine ligase/UDP-N-acetylenolpyruvoylglucosamine reductase
MLTKQQLIEFLGAGPCRVHFVGVGGIGMSGLAKILLHQGHLVTGSDLSPNGETKGLKELGAIIYRGHSADHVKPDTELVVYTSAVNGENEELQAAAELKIPSVRRGVLLTALMNHRDNIAVAGTHGKTTTTSMIACVLTRSDSAPSFCVGAHVPTLGSNAQIGAGKYFVAEADESDGTLIGFSPEYAVCLNIESEHLDFHRSMQALLATFETFLTSTLKTVFYCADCANCVALAKKLRSAISFGLAETADYRALDIQPTRRGSRFTVACRDQNIGTVELIIPGKQNVVNALAAIAVADQLGVSFERVAEALGGFTGAKRRFERRYDGDGVMVVDDYAHHPTEIRATIAAAQTLGFKRIIVAFQPHRYSRTQALRDQFATAFQGVDKLFLTDIYPANEKPLKGISGKTILDAVMATGQSASIYETDFEKLSERLLQEARSGDLILTMGAGDIYKVAQTVAEKLVARGPNIPGQTRRTMNIESELRGMLSAKSKVRPNEVMACHTSLKVGGLAEFWIEPWDEGDLAKLLHYCHEQEIPITIIGRGTNLLVRDGGIPGVVIQVTSAEFSRVEVDGERLIARSGARLKSIVNLAKRHELGGLEFLEGIPGSLGGALRMNAGAMGRQTFDVVEWVRYVSYSGEVYDADAKNLPMAYRNCPVFTNHVVLSAILRGEKTPRATTEERLRTFEKRRWASQPAMPSAGCIFKNPETIPAGKLIEELGLKGVHVGGARVSEVHGNFIVNEGGATAADVLRLIGIIRERARQERGIELETEVMILGKDK